MNNPSFHTLYEMILKLQNEQECHDFFEDLCTINELESMTQRIEAAKMLLQGETYNEVIKKVNISSATLSRVSKCIKYGDGGYKTIIERPVSEEKEKKD